MECEPLLLQERPENLDQVMGSLENLAAWHCCATADQVTKALAGARVDDSRHVRTADGASAPGARFCARVERRGAQRLSGQRSRRSTDEAELRVASGIVLQDHGVARGEHHRIADDEDGTKGLVTAGVRMFGECERLAKKCFVGVVAGARRASV